MIVVADAGPLMAFAKIGALETLFSLFPKIVTTPAVYEETVTAGLRLKAQDAVLLQSAYDTQKFEICAPQVRPLPAAADLGKGEEESILLAIERAASLLLIDDREARHAAEANLQAAGVATKIKGTLGVLITAHLDRVVSTQRTIELLTTIEGRSDIWIHPGLCQAIKATLESEA